VVTPNTGDRFNVNAAKNAARAPQTCSANNAINHVVRANSKMNGRRTTIGASVPNKCAAPHDSHHAAGGWSKYPRLSTRPAATI